MDGRLVCNASPLIFLAKIDRLPLLGAYEILIPAQVEAEILKGARSRMRRGSQIISVAEGSVR